MRTLLIACAIAVAAPASSYADAPNPWAEGVPQAEQTIALDLYSAGNDEFVQSRYSQALVKYREALAHWDHPAIRYNMAICLIEMHEPLEAYEHLEAALKYGQAPFDADKYQKGIEYRDQLLAQLSSVDVNCSTESARVTLDGQPLLVCPGNIHRVVMPGRHELVARREGFLTYTEDITAVAGGSRAIAVTLSELHAAKPAVVQSTDTAQPSQDHTGLIVLGAGAALGAVALGYDLFAVQPARDRLTKSADEFDMGLSTFKTRRNVDIAMFATAGAAIAVGAYLYVRRGHSAVVLAPAAGPGTAMVTVQWH